MRLLRLPRALVGALAVAVVALGVLTGPAASAAGPALSGTVVTSDGVGIAGASVSLSGVDVLGSRTTLTAGDGSFAFDGLADGQYRVSLYAAGFVPQRWGQPDSLFAGDVVRVTGGRAESTVDAVMVRPGTIRVTLDFGGYTRVPGDSVSPTWSRWDPRTSAWSTPSWLDAVNGATGLAPGRYRITVDYLGAPDTAVRDRQRFEVTIAEGEVTAPYAVTIRPALPKNSRLTGADRFGTAVGMSQRGFKPGVPVVYIVNGMDFPDALSAGPAAAEQKAPVLLVAPTFLPTVVAAELTRLRPARIVVLGGQPSVSDAVAAELARYAPVQRITGTDRYQTSRNVALAAFGPTAGSAFRGDVFITTGNGFADGVAAGAAAAHRHAPVLLVNGGATTLDADTLRTLRDLKATRVYVIGGDGSVSPGFEADLRAAGGMQVIRLTGNDRYQTSEIVTSTIFAGEYTDPHEVYFASGMNFPDALAGAALAATTDSPLMLIPPSCIPPEGITQSRRTDVREVVFLGGPTLILPGIERFAICR